MLKSSENQFSKFATRKWYVVDSESIDLYSIHNSIKFLTKSIQSDLCNCCDAYILVIKNIVVARADNNTKVAFKIAQHSENVKQKRMILWLMKQNLLILQCLCTI